MNFRKILLSVSLLSCIIPAFLFAYPANTPSHYDYLKSTYRVHPNGSFSEDHRLRVAILNESCVKDWRRYSISYYPALEHVVIDEAFVIRPDGKRIDVRPSDMVSSRTAQSSSMRVATVMDVYFPQVQANSKVFIHYHKESREPSIFGFNLVVYPDMDMLMLKHDIRVIAPKSLALRWHAYGNYSVKTRVHNNTQIIDARARNIESIIPESNMVSPVDVSSHFMVSSLAKWQQIGDIYWQHAKSKITVDKDIRALAKQISGNKKGLSKIVALNKWVATKIQYHGLSFDLKSNFIPHTSLEVLAHGYGDCKDKVTLLQALATASGIESYPVLVNWGKSFKAMPIPHPYQFNHLMIYFPKYGLFANPTDENASIKNLDYQLANKLVVLAGEHSRTAHTPKSIPDNDRYHLHTAVKFDAHGDLIGSSESSIQGGLCADILNLFDSYPSSKAFTDDFLSMTAEGGRGDSVLLPGGKNHAQCFTVKSHWRSQSAIELDDVIILPVPQGIDIRSPRVAKSLVNKPSIQYPILCRAQHDSWEYELMLPQGYDVIHMPKNILVKNREGSYRSEYVMKNGKVFIRRELIINQYTHTPQHYPEFRGVFTKALLDLRSQIVLKRKGEAPSCDKT